MTSDRPDDEASVRELLDRLASEQRRDLDDAAREEGDDTLVERTLAGLWAAEGEGVREAHPENGARGRRRWIAVAASVLIALVVWRTTTPDDDPLLLGADDFRLLEPRDAFDEVGELRWTHPAPAGLQFEVRVIDPAAPRPADVVSRSPRLDEMRWRDPAGTLRWPDRVRIEITALDRSGLPVAGTEAELRRSR